MAAKSLQVKVKVHCLVLMVYNSVHFTTQESAKGKVYCSGSKEPQPDGTGTIRKQWTAENMEKALREVTNGQKGCP